MSARPKRVLDNHNKCMRDHAEYRRQASVETLRPAPPRKATLSRAKTLTRNERFIPPTPLINPRAAVQVTTTQSWWRPWHFYCIAITCWAPAVLLSAFGIKDAAAQYAWREKVALCSIAIIMGAFVGFATIGLNRVLCPETGNSTPDEFIRIGDFAGFVGINGWVFNTTAATPQNGVDFRALAAQRSGQDVTSLFDMSTSPFSNCVGKSGAFTSTNTCTNATSTTCLFGAPTTQLLASLGLANTTKKVGYDWDQVSPMQNYMVLDGTVLNMNPYMIAHPTPIPNDQIDTAIRYVLRTMDAKGGKDGTRLFSNRKVLLDNFRCLTQKYRAGYIDKITPGCFASQLFLYVSLVIILGVVFARFAMAVVFSWFISRKLVRPPKNLKRHAISPAVMVAGANLQVNNKSGTAPWTQTTGNLRNRSKRNKLEPLNEKKALPSAPIAAKPVDKNGMISMASIGAELFTACLVTCYSEGLESIQGTLDSIAGSDYADARKLLFVVCDGMITGSGEKMSTPDICVGLIDPDPRFGDPQPMSYLAVASGRKQHNRALVYAGHYTKVRGHRTPCIVIVKTGTTEEASDAKPGNRGKRDSQMILMNFFTRVTYNDRMTPLDYDLFRKLQALMGVTPDFFECVLMVDADTKIYADSLKQLVNCMQHDNLIMGICGETRIANKRESWVTAIQVYEYFISHHLAKAFESVFGGVTCLPGCFSMYRLKARKANETDWVPILSHSEIARDYSQTVVETLHEKNLLLLGEDRFLTTLMIRTFPNRKMMFCPQAKCRTVVPNEFKVLLSQRRRWINSTIHNLMELVRVQNLCGTFCFSMQFVVFMELIGTVVLPVAICLTYTLLINYCFNPPANFSDAIPLFLLGAVLGLPAVLIVIATRKIVYVSWMLIYLLALPIWNFVLPVYSFLHFDDFTWGQTRQVEGETKQIGHSGGGGTIEVNAVPLRRWEDWERSRQRKAHREERRRREFERAFGSRAIHNQDEDEDRSSRFMSETASVFSSADEDRWGINIGTYTEDAVSDLPPVGLYDVDDRSEYAVTVDTKDLESMLEQGWEEDDTANVINYTSGSGYPTSSQRYPDATVATSAVERQYLGHVKRRSGGITLEDRGLSPVPLLQKQHFEQW